MTARDARRCKLDVATTLAMKQASLAMHIIHRLARTSEGIVDPIAVVVDAQQRAPAVVQPVGAVSALAAVIAVAASSIDAVDVAVADEADVAIGPA